ncbi:MAG: hypothetical protein K8J08_09895 [Thermoanaerobaculia bacterium]|nr:hypothetical protein [Thermoanaerobaculia bacterium]
MLRFLLLALPLVTLELGIGAFVQDLLGIGLKSGSVTGGDRLWELGLEAVALTGLFLLVQGRGGSWWRDGLLAGGVAWVFRGALTVTTVARVTSLPQAAWVDQAHAWLVLYALVGLLLGGLARWCSVGPDAPDQPTPYDSVETPDHPERPDTAAAES